MIEAFKSLQVSFDFLYLFLQNFLCHSLSGFLILLWFTSFLRDYYLKFSQFLMVISFLS